MTGQGNSRRARPVPGQLAGRSVRSADDASGAAESAPEKRRCRHAGLRHANQGYGRGCLRSVADADVPRDDLLMLKLSNHPPIDCIIA